ncbi:Sodium/hydrogen exchanger [Nemania sp. NC0429]|nr:Sodium/hydrogen exchanger [Nemania sp. NC0429]
MPSSSYLPYHEPSIVELLISSTFLLALNAINSVIDRTLACGLVGQVLIGTAWGEPGARWLPADVQRVVSSLGYLGLILVVYAGGVETDVAALRKNIVLSAGVAITGVVVPIGLSFALLASGGPFLGAVPESSAALLPAFAAGAALCSTSLGTTFSVLQASGLSRTRLGAVLASAALLDDVVGLVMVRIITGLGQTGNGGIEPATILRPVLVSVAFAVITPLACRHALRPGKRALDHIVQGWDKKRKRGERQGNAGNTAIDTTWIRPQQAALVIQTTFLISLIVAADYAGASILLAAYLAGVVVSWWAGQRDGSERSIEPQNPETPSGGTSTSAAPQAQDQASGTGDQETPTPHDTASSVFDTYYAPVVNRVLKPFFFASIGFSIPISQLFKGEVVWRGIIYSILMIIGKLVCGLWLVRFSLSLSGAPRRAASFTASRYSRIVSKIRSWSFRSRGPRSTVAHERRSPENPSTQMIPMGASTSQPAPPSELNPTESTAPSSAVLTSRSTLATPPKPLSLYPAAVMGCAMVSRGEIGFLISSMAESQGIFRRPDEDPSRASELFLVVTWAIFVCTILGPVFTGLLVKRIKKLERATEASRGGARNVLGVWGVG